MRSRWDQACRLPLVLSVLAALTSCGGKTSQTELSEREPIDAGVEDAAEVSPDVESPNPNDGGLDATSPEECAQRICASNPCLGGGCCPDQAGNRPMLEVDYFTCTFQVGPDDFRCPATLDLVRFLINGEFATFVQSEEDCQALDGRPGIVTNQSSTAADFGSGAVFWMCQASCDGLKPSGEPEIPEVQAVLGCGGVGLTCD